MTEILGIRRKLEKRLKPERYEHTLGVMYTAASLAMCYETDIHQAMLAGCCTTAVSSAPVRSRSNCAGTAISH